MESFKTLVENGRNAIANAEKVYGSFPIRPSTSLVFAADLELAAVGIEASSTFSLLPAGHDTIYLFLGGEELQVKLVLEHTSIKGSRMLPSGFSDNGRIFTVSIMSSKKEELEFLVDDLMGLEKPKRI